MEDIKFYKYRVYYIEDYKFLTQPSSHKRTYMFDIEALSKAQARRDAKKNLLYKGCRLGTIDFGRDEAFVGSFELELVK